SFISFSFGEGGPERFRDEVGLPREIQLAEYFIGDEADEANFKSNKVLAKITCQEVIKMFLRILTYFITIIYGLEKRL
ncbi:MAG: hypothetical protein Q7J16_09550, partial [Candidatus Cloacimonadales bacterium]|nr:hypothetical protein [Candidatus Cloacimonadales bacterium]